MRVPGRCQEAVPCAVPGPPPALADALLSARARHVPAFARATRTDPEEISMTSTPTPPRGSPSASAAQDVAAVLAACQGRVLEREGVATFAAIDDVRPGRALTVHDEEALREGRRLAELFEHYHGALARAGFPVLEGLDVGELQETGGRELMDTLFVLSDQHLRAATEALP